MPKEEIEKQMDVLRERAVDQAVGARLLMDEAERLSLQPSDKDIEDRIQAMVDDAGGDDAFRAALEKQHLNLEMVRDGVRRGRRVDMLVDKVASGISDPTEDEVRAHFDAHGEEYLKAERAQAQHILVKPDSDSDEDREAARARVVELRSEIESGTDFSEMAAAHSECPSGQRTGGSLGWFSRGMMVPEFDEAVFSMEVGELSAVVETGFGFHLIKKTGHENESPAEYADVAEKIRDFLRHTRRGEMIAAHVAELREKADVVIEA
jgi:parvulin-like peptidyl-prolyl isomerase